MDQMPRFTRAHCNACSGERNHVVLHSVHKEWHNEDTMDHGGDTYETLQCAGCDAIKLRHTESFSYEPFEAVAYFPAATFRRHPEWYIDLLMQLPANDNYTLELLSEVYVAMQHNLLRVAAMGVRSLLESIMISKAGDHRSFARNVNEFERQGYVSRFQKEHLLAILDAGNATVHRNYSPSRKDVITLIDITEHIIEAVYIHEPKVKELKARVPKRENQTSH